MGAAWEATAGGGWVPKRLPGAGPGPPACIGAAREGCHPAAERPAVTRSRLVEAAVARPVEAAWLKVAGGAPELATAAVETPRAAGTVTGGALEATGGGGEVAKGGGEGPNAGGSRTGLGRFPSRPSKPRLGPCPSCCSRPSCSSSLMLMSVSSCCFIRLSS